MCAFIFQCIPPAYLSLQCLGGECGTILEGGAEKCPLPCSIHKKCGDCRKSPGCGWCAFGGLNGLGVCMAGTRSGPRGQCQLGNVSYEDGPLAGNIINFSHYSQWALEKAKFFSEKRDIFLIHRS